MATDADAPTSEGSPSPALAAPVDVREHAHREQIERARRLSRENVDARVQTRDAWQRLVDLRQGVFADRDLRLAALNLLEDTEIARRREEEEAAGRQRAEAATQASDTRYQTLFESMDEGFCIIEVLFDASGKKAVDYRFVEANPAFARHTGLVNSLGRRMRELAPAHEEHWFEAYGRIALTGEPARFEQRASALGRDYDVFAFRIGTAGENRVAILFRDISERKRVEEALRQSEARQSFLVKLSDAIRPFAEAVDVQEVAARVLGEQLQVDRAYYVELDEARREFFVARDWHQPGAPSHAPRYPLANWPMPWLIDGQTWVMKDVDSDLILPDEQRASYRGNGIRAAIVVPMVKAGRLVATFVVSQNAPREWKPEEVELVRETAERTWAGVERARAEEALRASEEQFRRAIEDAPVPVIMHAEDGQVLQISRTWTELTGYTQQDIPTFDAWLNHAYGLGAGLVRDRMEGVFNGKQRRQQFELQIQTRSGERRDWEFTISTPGRLVDGRRFAVGMVNDLTERMRAERKLRNSEERLREADRRKNQFLAMLGHELRNPLAAIHGGVALLRSKKTQAATRARTLPIVADQVAHMERLVDDLLDITRIVAGRVQLRPERVTVQAVLRDALNMLQTQIESAAFDIRQRVASEPLTVIGDSVRLNQVIVNVLGNAMKYSGESRRIDLSASSEGGEAVISISDHGLGITPELMPHIFEPFVQAKPAITLKEGLGLGLAVARQLVELHGGRVEAFSEGERKGSKFVVYLPLAAGSV